MAAVFILRALKDSRDDHNGPAVEVCAIQAANVDGAMAKLGLSRDGELLIGRPIVQVKAGERTSGLLAVAGVGLSEAAIRRIVGTKLFLVGVPFAVNL